MLIRSHVISASLAADNTLKRVALTDTPPLQGTINSLELDFSSISGAASMAKLTLSWVNADRRYLVNAETSLTINVDAADSTKGSFEIAVTKEFNGIPSDATGIWLGIQLNAGTATVVAYLGIRGHA